MRILGRDFDGFRRALDRQLAAYEDPRSVAPRWLSIDELETTVRHRPDEFDIALVVTDWLPHLQQSGTIQPLDSVLESHPPEQWPEGWSPSMRTLQRDAQGRTWALPYHDGPMLLLYRHDLFNDPGEQSAFHAAYGHPLTPPETWEEFRQVAQFFTREGLSGTVMAGYPDAHNTVYDFLMQLWSRGGDLFDTSGNVIFDSAAGLGALTYLEQLWLVDQVIDPSALGMDSVASGRAFAAGKAAMTVNWAGFAAMSAPPDSPTHGKVACAPPPKGDQPGATSAAMNVYWVTVVSSKADLDAVGPFLAHLHSPAMDRITSREGATGTRLSTWRDPQIRKLSPYYEVIEAAHKSAKSPPPRRDFPEIAMVLDQMVASTIRGESPAPEALAEAADTVRHLVQSASAP